MADFIRGFFGMIALFLVLFLVFAIAGGCFAIIGLVIMSIPAMVAIGFGLLVVAAFVFSIIRFVKWMSHA